MDDSGPANRKTVNPRYGVDRSRRLRRDATEAERRIWLSLRNRRLFGFKFRRQQQLGPYIVDFFCAEGNLIVELDGGQHMENAQYDKQRTKHLSESGYRVLRFWNNDALANTSGVLETILRELLSTS